MRVMKIDYGHVNVGSVAIRSVKISNESRTTRRYEALPLRGSDPIFTVGARDWSLHPGETLRCEVTYRPIVPNRDDADCFHIAVSDESLYKIVLRGTCVATVLVVGNIQSWPGPACRRKRWKSLKEDPKSWPWPTTYPRPSRGRKQKNARCIAFCSSERQCDIGPKVVVSPTRLVMVCSRDTRAMKKRIRLTNNAGVASSFTFDVDGSQCAFKLDVDSGFIPPKSHTRVTVQFLPRKNGFFASHLPCLVHHQDPIIVEVYGYRGPLFSKSEQFELRFFNEASILGFPGYMTDAVNAAERGEPAVSLTPNHLEFGQVTLRGSDDARGCVSRIVCLCNHSAVNMTIEWDEDVEGIFTASPRVSSVGAERSVLFQIQFAPDKPDALFSRVLSALLYWQADFNTENDAPVIAVPLITSVRLIGHSFTGEAEWVPSYELPDTVVLPPCVPPLPVYATLVVESREQLPMTFQFLPPPNARFAVKPMVGMIRGGPRIVAIQLFSEANAERVYVERWTVRFNCDARHERSIDFMAYVEYPELVFNDDNVVEFPPVYPRCPQYAKVSVRNATRHCVRYAFHDLPNGLHLENMTGDVRSNEILTHDWIFCPETSGEHRYPVTCDLTALGAGSPMGTAVRMQVLVTGRAELGYLEAIPKEVCFGVCGHNDTKKLSFHVFNRSPVKIDSKLISIELDSLPDINATVLELQPATGSIGPGDKVQIDVLLTPKMPGFHQFEVGYLTLFGVELKTCATEAPRSICKVNATCVLPRFQIKDLSYHDVEGNLSKVILWRFLNITKFNAVADSILPGERKVVNLRFPERCYSREPLVVKLLVVNSSPFTSSWTLSRIRLCSCEPIAKRRGFNFQRVEYQCDHRTACSITPNNATLEPREETVVTIEVRYVLPGETTLQWQLNLENDRRILVNAMIVVLPDSNLAPRLFTKVLSLEKIYIGDLEPIDQMCWMYNSMNHEVAYFVDTGPLLRLNSQNFCDVFLCRNPRGTLPAKSTMPIIFNFQPRRLDSFQVNVPLKVGETWTNLLVRAESTIVSNARIFAEDIPRFDQFYIPEMPVDFSADRLVISPVPIRGVVTRMIMIFNRSESDVIGYQWKSFEVPGVLKIVVAPAHGRIRQAKMQSFLFSITTGSRSSKIDACVDCQFFNHTAQRKYERELAVRNALREDSKQKFIITEHGAKKLEPTILELAKPQKFYKSVSVSCYVYGPSDTELKATLKQQLKSAPPIETPSPETKSSAFVDEKMLGIAAFVFEGIIWEILHGRLFLRNVEEVLSTTSDPDPITFPTKERNLHRFEVPSMNQMDDILTTMIYDIVHDEFQLDAHHLDGPRDIRQFCYRKMHPYAKQLSLAHESPSHAHLSEEKEYNPQPQSPRVHFDLKMIE